MATVEEKIPPLEAGQHLSRAEFLRRWEAMPNVKQAELLGGVVYMPSPLSRLHGRIGRDVGMWLGVYQVDTPGCDGGNEATWLMPGEETPQPDSALWILPEYGGQSGTQGIYCAGAPELLVEVSISRSNYDRGEKREIYRASGVREYVIVLPDDNEILWHRLADGEYHFVPPDAGGIWRSQVFPGLWLHGAALIGGDGKRLLSVLAKGIASEEHQRFVAELAQRRSRTNGI
jgi:Uma2 family endonuclease